jgi:Holliday junction DNA helicase RuvA
MISFLRGTVVELLPMRLVIEVAGVGYDVNIPLSTYDKLPQPGQTAKVLTHLQVREDAHVLFGFATAEERDLFHLLVNNVSGIGPKLALAVLNGITPDHRRTARQGRRLGGVGGGLGRAGAPARRAARQRRRARPHFARLQAG